MENPNIPFPTTFLSLAPVHSATYPTTPSASTAPSAVTSPTKEQTITFTTVDSPTTALASIPEESPRSSMELAMAVVQQKITRTDSMSSTASDKPRFLKLGPVYWGGEVGVGDYAEE